MARPAGARSRGSSALTEPADAAPGTALKASSESLAPEGASELRRELGIAALLFVLALGLRLAFALQGAERAWPHTLLYEGDAPVWVEWARALRDGRVFEHGLPNRPPGAAHLLAWIQPRAEPPFVRAKLVWCALSALAVPLAYLCFRRVAARAASLVGALWLALSFVLLQSASSLNVDAPYGTLLLFALLGGALAPQRARLALAAGLGLCHGLAALLRAEHLALFALLLALATLRLARAGGWGRALRDAAVQLVLCALVLAPWTLAGHRALVRYNTQAPPIAWERLPIEWSPDARQRALALPAFARAENVVYASDVLRARGARSVDGAGFERFLLETFGFIPGPLPTWVPVAGKGALDFALANHLASDGGFTRAPLDRAGLPRPPLSFSLPHHLELYRHGVARALEWMRERPREWLALCVRKLRLHLLGWVQGLGARNFPLGLELERPPVDLATARGAGALLLGLALLALALLGLPALLRARGAGAWLALLGFDLALTLAFYGYARTALPFLPALALLVALGLERAHALLAARAPAFGRVAPYALAGLALLALRPPLPLAARALDAARPLEARPDLGARAAVCVGPLRIEPVRARSERPRTMPR